MLSEANDQRTVIHDELCQVREVHQSQASQLTKLSENYSPCKRGQLFTTTSDRIETDLNVQSIKRNEKNEQESNQKGLFSDYIVSCGSNLPFQVSNSLRHPTATLPVGNTSTVCSSFEPFPLTGK